MKDIRKEHQCTYMTHTSLPVYETETSKTTHITQNEVIMRKFYQKDFLNNIGADSEPNC